MTHEEIIETLRELMRNSSQEDADWDSVSGDDSIEDLGFDSLSILDLIYDIQQEFGVEFEPESIAGVKTVDGLAEFLKDVIDGQ